MAYHKYHTEGWVLGAYPRGESSQYVWILTRDMGMVSAVAQGVRELASKLRYGLQQFSVSDVELIRGRDAWRVVRAEPHGVFATSTFALEKRRLLAQLALLVRRLAPPGGGFAGEHDSHEDHAQLYDEIIRIHRTLASEDYTADELGTLEAVSVARLLDAFGYWGRKDIFAPVFAEEVNTKEALQNMVPLTKKLIHEINTALEETQL